MKNSLLFIIPFLVFACTTEPQFWDIKKFNIQPSALHDGESVRIIYTSGRWPDDSKKNEYYIHLVAISQSSHDTVNILTTSDNGLNEDDGNKIFQYMNQDNPTTKLLQMDFDNVNVGDRVNPKDLPVPDIKKVVRHIGLHDAIADNIYPTVIGSIGIITKKSSQ